MIADEVLCLAEDGKLLKKDEALVLLNIKNHSKQFYSLLSLANRISRHEFSNKGLIFAQIGLNAEPCSKNCKFCSMGQDHYALKNSFRKDMRTILEEVRFLVAEGIDDLFLMTTADYPLDQYMEIAFNVRKILPEDIKLVANIGDFDLQTALAMKRLGFTGAYHVHRLREGIDTTINPETRIKTLDAIQSSGLELYYCIEPIGPEHNYEELVAEMLRARTYNVGVMAVMRRTPVEGTPLYEKGQISALELTKIAAVTRLVSRPSRAMNVHEVTPMSLLGGVNQLYAELGGNPRDTITNTEYGRGYSVSALRQLLWDAEYQIASTCNISLG